MEPVKVLMKALEPAIFSKLLVVRIKEEALSLLDYKQVCPAQKQDMLQVKMECIRALLQEEDLEQVKHLLTGLL